MLWYLGRGNEVTAPGIEGDRLEGEKRGDHIKVRREKRET